MSVLLKEKCVLCSTDVVKNSPAHFKLDCNHCFCQTCIWEMSQQRDSAEPPPPGVKPAPGTMVLIECTQCKRKTPFNASVLPDTPAVTALCGDFGDISLNDSDMEDLEWGDENQGPTYKKESNLAEVTSSTRDDKSPSATSAQLKKIRELLETAEKKFSERLVKHDSDKIASVCQALEKKSTKSFTEIVDGMRSAGNQVFDEAQLLVDKKIDYLRRSSTDLKNRCAAKAEAVAAIRKTIDGMSFFNASNSDAACLYMKVAKLKEEISSLSDVAVPFGSFKEVPLAESFFANYSNLSLGTFDAKLAHKTPSPLMLPQPPKCTPSPLEWPPTIPEPVVKVKEEKREIPAAAPPAFKWDEPKSPVPSVIKVEPKLVEPVAVVVNSAAVEPATETSASSKQKSVCSYDASLYSRMTMFAMVTSLTDEKRSLCRPVGVCTVPDATKRRAAVVHTGHKVTLFSASANVIGTYVLIDPDNKGRLQLVGDIAADSEGWIYVIDRDNLPSRIFAFQPDRIAPEERQKTVPDVFARFNGRTRIYGLAASSSKQTLYTSTRDKIVAFSLGKGEITFECELKNPPSAYVHSLFEENVSKETRLSHIPFVVFTANEGRSVYKKAIIGKGNLETASHLIAAHRQEKEPISLVRRTGCDPVGNILGADSGNKEIRVFSSSGEPIAKFAPPRNYGPAFSASGVAVIPAHPNLSSSHAKIAEKCAQGKTHLGPVVVVTDFECHRILFFDVPSE